ncbi:MAG: aldehyde dehydrogenase (NADP(+)) [Bacteroidota bacterium]
MMEGKNYIGFSSSAKGTEAYRTYNPKEDKENTQVYVEATLEEINTAAQLAAQAFQVFRRMPGAKRAEFLHAIADEILALDDLLIQTYVSETGLPEGRAKGERGRTVGQLRMFADLIQTETWRNPTLDEAVPDRTPVPKPDLRQFLIPLGPVAVFGASNFPLAYSTAGGDTASALAAGCPVIVKSHPMHAGTGGLVASAIIKAAKDTGMPEGVFSNINSAGIEVGTQLVAHPQIKAVGFTGSIQGGRALCDLAAQRDEPIPVFAEMGSINPVIITKTALENRGEEIATTYASSITLGTGQFCTNPGLLLAVEGPELTSFVDDLARKTMDMDAQCMLHPTIHSAFEHKAKDVIDQEETRLVAVYKGETPRNYAKAKIVTVTGDAFLKNPRLHQEVFGPFSMVVQCADNDEMLKVIAGLEGQLTGTIIAETSDYGSLHSLVETLQDRVGRIVFNGVPTGVEVCDAMTHGGPYPASSDSRFTAVGNQAIKRWVRPFSYQNFPEELLPESLRNK